MDFEKTILDLLQSESYSPLRLDEIYKKISKSVPEATFSRVKKALHKLLRARKISKMKGDKFALPKAANLISGEIFFRQNGSAKLIPDDLSASKNPILIRSGDTSVALHGDKVLVKIVPKKQRPKARERFFKGEQNSDFGVVVEILSRAFSATTGTLQKRKSAWFVVPDDPKIGREIRVPEPSKSGVSPLPKDGSKVLVKLNEWRRRSEILSGKIERNLGISHTPAAEYQAILLRYNLSPSFPKAVRNEVSAFPREVVPADFGNRKDIRKIFTITIDPDDAKDFDDALSVEFLPNNKTKIGIHIADVSHYVRSGTALDAEARFRGNSTYLVGTVIPMLPHELSSGICSLVENENRLTKSVFITFSERNEIVDTEFANTVISSRKRLTYAQAFAFMKGLGNAEIRAIPKIPAHQSGHPGRDFSDLNDVEIDEIRRGISALWNVAKTLRERRFQLGALDLEMPEMKIYVDADGNADRIEKIEHDESHQLVEEFMLLANEIVAKALHKANLPFISRVHDAPEAEKLAEFREELLSFGIKVGDLSKRSEVTKFLEILKSRDDAYLLRIRFLRSLKQACYRAKCDGHYGLAKNFYAHFTSPIRRYADLTVHRIFDFYLQKNRLKTAPTKHLPSISLNELESAAEHISETERNSAEAERESKKVKLLEFFEREQSRKKKNVFEAVITEFRNIGIFIELSVSQAFGMIPMSEMNDDFYYISSDETELVGRRSRKTFRLGDVVFVEVLSVDRFRRTMNFSLSKKQKKGRSR